MASNTKVTDTINWTLPFIKYSPLLVGANNEPSVSNANMIKQIFLSPPFSWRWNRAIASKATVANQQDLQFSIPDFGYLEKAVVQDANGVVNELDLQDLISELGLTAEADRPTIICTQFDDNAGNITFRMSPVPDAIYTLKLTYQKKPSLITSANIQAATATWAPIPDEYIGIIVQPGMLALAMAATDDGRFPVYWNRFLAGLVGVSEGLTETDKILFMGNMIAFNRQLQEAQLMTQQGIRGRVA